MHRLPPNTNITPLYSLCLKTALHRRQEVLEISMRVNGQKIVLVALNGSSCAVDTSTMLSVVEVLVMGSDPLSCCVGGKVIPAQGEAVPFLSISSMQEQNVEPFLFLKLNNA